MGMTVKEAIGWLKMQSSKPIKWDDYSEENKRIREEAERRIKEAFNMAIEALKAQEPRVMTDTELEAIRKAPLILKPNVDAAPVVHGRWMNIPDKPEWDQKMCSVCGDYFCCQGNYCPNCGAKMDGERRDDSAAD